MKSECFQFFQGVAHILFDPPEIRCQNLFFGDKYISPLFQLVVQIDKSGAHTPFGKVSGNGIAHFFACGKSDTPTASLFVEGDCGSDMFFGGFVVEVGKLLAGAKGLEVF